MMSPQQIDELLDLAYVPDIARGKARGQLEMVLESLRGARPASATPLAHALTRVANPDLVPADDNEHLDELANSARELLKRLRALRGRPYQHLAFWGHNAFGSATPAHYMRPPDATLPIETETGLERGNVIPALLNIITAADRAKAIRPANRPKAQHKVRVVECAALFWLQHSSHEISGTATGKFHTFAEAFHAAATGATGRERNVDRIAREVARRARAGAIW